VEQTLKSILSPYRTEDVDEVMEILKSSGGIDKLHMAFYQQEDRGATRWTSGRVEGLSLSATSRARTCMRISISGSLSPGVRGDFDGCGKMSHRPEAVAA
jgi:hypothetical protein